MRAFIFVAAIVGVTGFFALAYFPDPLLLFVYVIGGGLWIGLPLLTVGLIFLIILVGLKRSVMPAVISMGVVGVAFLIGGLAIPVNALVYHQAEIAAMEYPDKVGPLLDAYRAEHGVYPESLDRLPNRPPLPRLLRSGCYRSDGVIYSFSFKQPGTFITFREYLSIRKTWR